MDLSNKSLAMLLLAAMIISLGGTFVTLNRMGPNYLGPGSQEITGQVSGSGYTAVNISSLVGCSIDSSVDFGDGTAPSVVTNISSDLDNSGSGFGTCNDATPDDCEGLQINNTGNVDLNVTFNSSQDAVAFLGGPSVKSADFIYKFGNGTAESTRTQIGCFNGTSGGTSIAGWADWQTIPTTPTAMCYNFTPDDAGDMMTIEFNLTLRPDTDPGEKNTTIQINCQQI